MTPAIILRGEEQRARAHMRIDLLHIDPAANEPWAIWIGPFRKIRTLAQNALYWHKVGIIQKATGHDKDALHEYFKRKVLGFKVAVIDGELIERAAESSKSSRGDFSELIEYVDWWMAENGIEEAA